MLHIDLRLWFESVLSYVSISLPDLKTWSPDDDFDGSIILILNTTTIVTTSGINIVCRSSSAGH